MLNFIYQIIFSHYKSNKIGLDNFKKNANNQNFPIFYLRKIKFE